MNKPSVKSMDMEMTQDERAMTLDLHSLQLYATSVQADYPSNEPVTTTLKVGGAGIERCIHVWTRNDWTRTENRVEFLDWTKVLPTGRSVFMTSLIRHRCMIICAYNNF